MSPGEIADRLAHRFSFLTSGARTAEARQQTLRATVEWSYALLSEVERQVFNRLSVFRGGWSLTAAEAVVADDLVSSSVVLDTIGRLVERSMVWVERGRTTRYRMLETLREYAAEQLNTSGEADDPSGAACAATSEASPSGPRSSCVGTGNARPCGCCERSNRTSGRPSPGCPGPVATSTRPW